MNTDLAPTAEMDITPYVKAGFGLKGLKKWNSREGGGYQFNLTHNGQVVAQVTNEGRGGEVDVNWKNLTWNGVAYIPADSTPAATAKINAQAALSIAAKDALTALIAVTPGIISEYSEPLTVDAGWVMEELVNFADLKKLCVKKTVFRPEGAKGDLILNAPFDVKVKAYIEKKYPKATILNETLATLSA